MSHYFAVYVPSPENPHGAVFNSLKDASKFANSPESKQFGARFKGFASPVDADQFAQHGDLHSLNSLCSLMKSCDTAVSTAGEPTVPYPSVSRVQLNRFKRAIETKADSTFDSLVDSNPRFLINIGADTATILAEGFRYNALHVAARVGNAYVVRRVLSLVTDSSFLISTYGTNEEDVRPRSTFVLDSYLNTPDKGENDTPLHLASKFGHLDIVELLIACRECKKDLRNKYGETPVDACCARFRGPEMESIKKIMTPLFRDLYITLYRPTDDYSTPYISDPGSYPPPNVLEPLDVVLRSPVSPVNFYIPAAVVGPFPDEESAKAFCTVWKAAKKSICLRDPLKGYETVGRDLAKEKNIRWRERWSFSENLVELDSFQGLDLLSKQLVKVAGFSVNPLSTQPNEDEAKEEDSFFDASEEISEKEFDGRESDDETIFCTPPPSPEPYYLIDGVPSRSDDQLVAALSLVKPSLLRQFPIVLRYLRKMESVSADERASWPPAGSPRARNSRSKLQTGIASKVLFPKTPLIT